MFANITTVQCIDMEWIKHDYEKKNHLIFPINQLKTEIIEQRQSWNEKKSGTAAWHRCVWHAMWSRHGLRRREKQKRAETPILAVQQKSSHHWERMWKLVPVTVDFNIKEVEERLRKGFSLCCAYLHSSQDLFLQAAYSNHIAHLQKARKANIA